MVNLAKTFLSLKKSEIAILKAVEQGMRRYEWVPLLDIIQMSKLQPKTAEYNLRKLAGRNLVYKTWEPYEGYQIGFFAYDILTLADLVERDEVSSLGEVLGVGKESVVYGALGPADGKTRTDESCEYEFEAPEPESAPKDEWVIKEDEDAKTKDNETSVGYRTSQDEPFDEVVDTCDLLADENLTPLAIKFHREGQTSFKHVRRVRDHLTDVPKCPWIHAARLGARKEFRILKLLYPGISVPRPVAINRHAVVMEHLDGVELYKVDLTNPKECLDIILEEVRLAWKKGIIHADLSPYNVLIVNGEVKIIDWPQAVNRGHPEAQELLQRDLKNVVDHFRRKYHLEMTLEDAVAFVQREKEPSMR